MDFLNVIMDSLSNELVWFFSDMNWTFIIVLMFAFWGIKYNKEDFSWFDDYIIKYTKGEKFRTWIAGGIIALFFLFFRWRESLIYPDIYFNATYISALLRSLFVAITMSKILIGVVVVTMEKLGKSIGGKDNKNRDKDEIINILLEKIKDKDEN